MDLNTALAAPDVRRADSTSVVASQWYVPDRPHVLGELRKIAARWQAGPLPEGLLSLSCWLSDTDDTALTWAQFSDLERFRRTADRSDDIPLSVVRGVEYQLARSVVLDDEKREPGCVVIAVFDVDGAERQRRTVETVGDALERGRESLPGMLSANFHASVDGSRVLNYAEWTSAEAHAAFMDSPGRADVYQASSSLPGVRPIGYRRYRLYRSVHC